MKGRNLILSLLVLAWSAASASGSVLDAPHNETSNMTCGSCHTYSLWWQYSPSLQSTAPDHDTISSAICMTCHDTGSSLPVAQTHSAAVMGSSTYHNGTWGAGCTDCHNPHYQDQLNWAGLNDPYLLTGTIAAVTPDSPQAGQTTITYSGATSNANWPAGSWASKNSSGRGLILVHDKSQTANTFMILSDNATSSQIVINGVLDPAEINSATCTYANCATDCTSFGLIYGQLIRDQIDTPSSGSKDVVFFDSKGGFVDASNQGICQVCHTQTLHYTNSGPLPSGNDSHVGRDSGNCINCHEHITGFTGSGHEASHFISDAISGVTCTTCHDDSGAGIVVGIHNSSCAACHVDPGGGGALTVGSATNGVDGDATGESGKNYTSGCSDCHNNASKATVNTVPDIHHLESPNSYATNGNCTACHADEANKLAADHSTFIQDFVYDVPNSGSCGTSSCHAGNVGLTSGAPVDPNSSRIHDACTSCHETNGDLVAPTSIAPAMPLGGGACNVCHTDKTGAHIVDHVATGRVTLPSSGNCSGCHDATVNMNAFVDATNNAVHDSCDICHNTSDYSLRTDLGRTLVAGDCTGCHSDKDDGATLNLFAHKVDHSATNRVTVAANCTDCHASTVDSQNFVDAADAKKHNACSSCHIAATDLSLRTDAGRTLAAGDCAACHFNDFAAAPHKVVGHASMVAGDTACTDCHDATAGTATDIPLDAGTGSVANKVHDNCAACHTANGQLIDPATSALIDAMPVGAGGIGGTDGGGDCQACHTYTGGHIDHAATGRVTLPASGNCDNCHAATIVAVTFTDPTNNAVHDSCETCHVDTANNNYSLRTDAGRTLAAGDCTSCHSDKDDGTTLNLFAHDVNHADTNRVTLAANCTDCHASTVAYPAFVDAADTKKHNSCSSCHVSASDLSLRTDAGRTLAAGDCAACHFDDFAAAPHKVVGHASMVSLDPACGACHTDTAGDASSLPINTNDNKVHDNCAACHTANGQLIDPTTSTLVDAMPVGAGGIGGTDGGGDCQACHTYTGDHIDHVATGRVTLPTSGNCDTCHAATVVSTTFVDPTNNAVHDSCETCHVDTTASDYTLRTDTGRTLAPGDCTSCHSDKDDGTTLNLFAHQVDHNATNRVTLATDCSGCHATTVDNQLFVDQADPKKHNDCSSCHVSASDLSLRSDAGRTLVAGDCAGCHGDYFPNHQSIGHDSKVSLATECSGCHTGTEGSASGIPTDTANNKIHDDCTTCHDATGALTGSADGNPAPNSCANCHGTNIFTAHANTIGDHSGQVDYTTDNSCDRCHSGDVIDVVHKGNCGHCHDTADSYTLRSLAANGPGDCQNCHGSDWLALHPATITHDSQVGMATECSGCHTGTQGTATGMPVDADNNKIHDACSSCHDAAGNLTGIATGNTDPNVCTDCHGAYFDQHQNISHSSKVSLATECSGCHTGTEGNATGIPTDSVNNKIHDACTTCHDATGALTGSATGNTDPNSCIDCHGAYFPDHKNIGHGSKVGMATECSGCHTGTAGTVNGIPTDGNDNTIHDDCTDCHNASTGALIGLAIGNTAPNVCTDCHGDYFDQHLTINHSSKVSLATECAGCHTGTEGDASGIPTDVNNDKIHDACTSCHDATGALTGDAAGNADPNSCANCHGTDIYSVHAATVGDHGGQVDYTSDNSCERCHSGDVIDVLHKGNCGSCHDTVNYYNLRSLATNGPGNCKNCHGSDWLAIHPTTIDHDSQVGMATECSGCHTGTEGSASGIPTDSDNSKIHDACATCHDSAGNLTGSATGNTDPNVCTDCHGAYFDQHQNLDHSAKVSLAIECAGCHAGTAGNASGIPTDSNDNTVHDDCSSCHDATGALTGSAAGNIAPNSCIDCHTTADANDHITNHDATAYENSPTQETNPGIIGQCFSCHDVMGFTNINSGHMGRTVNTGAINGAGTVGSAIDCNTCHASTDANVIAAIAAGKADTTVSCADCHTPRPTPHGGHSSPDTLTMKTSACTVCHDRDEANPLEVVGDIHTNTCSTCHTTPPVLADPADKPNAIAILRGGDCMDCHGDSYTHDSATHSKITFGDDGQGSVGCDGCHDADPIVEHTTIRGWQCTVCHSNPCFDPVIDAAMASPTATVFCTDCHTEQTFPHGLIDHVGYGKVKEDLLCAGCHNPDNSKDWLVDIHGDGAESACGLCHQNPAGAGALIAVLENDADAVDGGFCTECHNATLSLASGPFHGVSTSDATLLGRHDNLASSAGQTVTMSNGNIIQALDEYNCDDCHMLPSNTIQARLEEHPGCLTCHNGIADYEAVIFNGMAGGNNIQQVCEDCHNDTINGGGNTNSPTGKAMYQYDGERHHDTESARKGVCDYCHADPRPAWEITYGATGPNPLPEQLACRECHIKQTENGVVVTKNSYTPTNVYFTGTSSWNLNTVASVETVVQHSIATDNGSPIAVNNYGACMFCHSVNVWHAKPSWNKDVNDSKNSNRDDTFDVLREAPGRSIWPSRPSSGDSNPTDNGGIAKFDIFSTGANTGGVEKLRMYGRYSFGDWGEPYGHSSSESRAADFIYERYDSDNNNVWILTLANAPLGFTRVSIPQVTQINDAEGLMSSNPMVPVFPAITTDPVIGTDLVDIVDAAWNVEDSGLLRVIAYNRSWDSVSLALTYGSQIVDQPMTWDASLNVWTYISASAVSLEGSVTVTSSHAGGGSDTLAVRDLTANTVAAGNSQTAQIHIDNATVNIPADVLPAGTCTDCHTGNLSIEHANRGKSCSTCHAPCNDGPLPTPLSTVDCYTCHETRPNDHPAEAMPEHSFLLANPDSCVSCHSQENIAAAVHASCFSCHDPFYDVTNMQAGTNGDATNHQLGLNSGCTTCHADYGTDFASGHQNEDHTLVTSTNSAQCTSCHGTTNIISVIHADNCNLCHTDSATDGALTSYAVNHTVGQESSCVNCHTDRTASFKDGHLPATHANLVATTSTSFTQNCAGCHTGDLVADPSIHNDNCAFCHADPVTDGTLVAGAKGDATTHQVGSQSECIDCHGGFSFHNTIHVVIELDPATDLAQEDYQPCYNCHNDNGGSLATWDDIFVEHLSDCSYCHDAQRDINRNFPTGTTVQDVINAAIADPENTTLNCLDCHDDKRAPSVHNIAHVRQLRVTADAVCVSCHDKNNINTDSYLIENLHDQSGRYCQTCHVSAQGGGALRDFSGANCSDSLFSPEGDCVDYESINFGAGGSCLTCHASYANFAVGHKFADHSGVTTSANCSGCHDEDYITGNNTHKGSCTRCHNNTSSDGTLRAATHGDASGHSLGSTSSCTSCHADHAANFQVAHETAHGVSDHDGIGGTAECMTCHGDTDLIGGAFTHKDNCDNCHTALPENGALRTGANGTASNHSVGTVSGCITCHSDYSPDFADANAHKVRDHDGLVVDSGTTPTTNCTGCHDGTNQVPVVHNDNCALCHTSGTGALISGSRGSAEGHVLGTPSECADCHGNYGYFDTHTHVHDVAMGTGDLAQTSNQPCSNCHDTQSTWDKVFEGHGSNCSTCHDATRSPVQDVITNHSGTVRCLDCHADKAAPAEHGLIDHQALGKVTWSTLCAGCHNATGNADVVYDVHKVGTKNMCGVCHENPYGVGPLREPWETDSPAGGECTDCHNFTAMDRHHTSEQTQAGDCTHCHTDPRPEWATTYGTFTPSPLPKQLACVECHVEPSGTGLVVYKNTYTPTDVTSFPSGTESFAVNGAAQVVQTPVHTIVGPQKIEVYNYGACLNCHDGSHATAPGIQVWHAKPTWNKDSHDTANGTYDNLFDVLRYAPGRSEVDASGTVLTSKFNLFVDGAGTGTSQVRMYGRYNFGNSGEPYKHTNSENRGKRLYKDYEANAQNPWFNDKYSQRITIPRITAVNDPAGMLSTNPQVPYFDDIAAPAVPDEVLITQAQYDGSQMTVWAFNDYADQVNLTFDYNGAVDQPMTWNGTVGRWEGTYPGYASTVTVSSDAAGGGSDSAIVTDITAPQDILYVIKSEWTADSGGTVTIWATHSTNNGTLTYQVDYNGFTGETMVWNGAEGRYELSVNGVPYGGSLSVANIYSQDAGGASVTIPVTDASGPDQDQVTIIKAVWDADDNNMLAVQATHLLNNGSLTYTADYNGSSGTMTWNQLRNRYDLILYNVTYSGLEVVTVSSTDPGGSIDTMSVVDITGTVDHEALQKVMKTASCSECHDWNPDDPKDVITDIHKGNCANCHTVWPNLLPGIVPGDCVSCHSDPYHISTNDLHSQITFGFGEGNSCAKSCHNSDALDEHVVEAVTGRTWECTTCHGSAYYVGIINNGIATTDPVYCTDCHTDQTFPHGSRNHAIRQLNNCIGCHDGGDTVEDIHLTVGSGNTCDTCHASTDTTVQNVITAGGGDCADCHAERYQHQTVGTHSISGSCSSCHTTGTIDELVTLHRDTCATCHTSTDPTVTGVIAAGGTVDCADCHGAGADHHTNEYAQAGDCAHCHTDPRPDWASTYGTFTPSPLPNQLACVTCHVESSGTGLVVYRNTYTPANVTSFPNGDTAWGVNGDATVQQTPVHTISGAAKIDVYNYGICLGCHDGNTPGAAAIQVWHAKPTWNKDSHDTSNGLYDNPYDVMRSAPGRSYYSDTNTPPRSASDSGADIRKFNIFATGSNTGGVAKVRMYGRYNFGDSGKPYKSTNSENRADRLYKDYDSSTNNPWVGSVYSQRVTIPKVNAVNNQQGLMSSNPQIPYYSDITPPVVGGGAGADQVTITQAWWYSTDSVAATGDLIVHAVSSGTDTLQLNGSNMALVGSHWEITLSSVANPASVSVVSTSANGGSDTAQVIDMSCYSCGYDTTDVPHSYIDNLVAGNCDQCHVGNLLEEHKSRGMSCSNCHESSNPVIQQAIDTGIYNSVTCETCHGPRSGEHPYDMHTHTVYQGPADLSQAAAEPCGNCHAVADWDQIEGYTHNVATNGPGSCNTCHLSDNTDVKDTILHNGWHSVTCLDCHGDKQTPAEHGNAHLMQFDPATDLAQADSQPCDNCHGSLDTYIEILVLHQHDCTVCHSATRDISLAAPTGTTIPDVLASQSAVTCLGCHVDQAAPNYHGPNHPLVISGMRDSKYGDSLTCSTAGCHADNTFAEHLQPGGIAYQKYLDAGTPFECSWCHQSLPVTQGMVHNDDPVINAAISKGVDQQADVYCSDCHAYSSERLDPYGHGWTVKYSDPNYQVATLHHSSSSEALTGNCSACHKDPRLDPYGTGVSLPAPKMLPCRDCHVKSEPNGGSYGTGQFTVYKSRTATQVDTGNEIGWTWQFDEPIANTDPITQTGVKHQWDVEGGMIDSFGICLFCHKMRPYHAKVGPPPEDPDLNTVNPGEDPPNYQGPGRGSLGVFYGTYRKPSTYYTGTGQGVSPYKEQYMAIRDHDSKPRADISYWAMITYDPQSDPNGQVPADHTMGVPEYFTVPTFDPPVGGDIVDVTTATFDNVAMELTVTATNQTTNQGYELYAIHSGTTIPMTEGTIGSWSATFSGYGYDISDQIGRVYVISVDPSTNYTLIDQAYTNPANDDQLTVLKAEWDGVSAGAELTVEVTNTSPGATVTVTYNGTTYPMSEVNTHLYMVTIGDATYVSTLDVSSDSGGSLLGEAVTEVTVGGSGGCDIDTNGTYIEAESYTTFGNTWQLASSVSGANGGQYLNAVSNNLNSPPGVPATYTVNFPTAGTYNISFRGHDNSNSGDNSLWYGLDGIMVGNMTTPGRNTNWNWSNTPHSIGPNPTTITVGSAGQHIINIWARENNFNFDGFYLKLNDATLPTGGIPSGSLQVDPQNCSGGGSTAPFADQIDDFSGLATGPSGRPNFGNWTGMAPTTTNTPWTAWCGQTPSSSTNVGPSVDYNGGTSCSSDVYLYMEGSATSATNGVGVSSNSVQYLESNSMLNASVYDFTFSFYYNMNFNGNSDGTLALEAWNGASWVTVDTVATGDQHNSTNWTKSADYSLNSFINADLKIRIAFTVGSNSAYRYDLGIDQMVVTGTIR